MIKLKNLWKIALATMAMSAMLVACDESGSKTGGDEKAEGVYSYTVNIEDISTAWGGTTASPAFSIMLLGEKQLEACKAAGDFKVATAAEPEYQLGAYGNLKIADTSKTGTFAIYGQNAVKDVFQYYTGVAATVTDTTVTVTIDMTKLKKTDLKALFAKGADNNSEATMTDDDIVDLAGCKPYILALASQENDPDKYQMNAWSADLMAMVSGATFPAGELVENAPNPVTIKAVNAVKGSVTGSSWPSIDLATDGSFEFIYNSSTMTEVRFIYQVKTEDGDYTENFKAQGSECKALGTDVVIKNDEGSDEACRFATTLFTDGTTYKVTLNKENSTCKITAK